MDDSADLPRARGRGEPDVPNSVETTERYEIDGGTVFFDARNPLAWVEATTTVALTDRL